MLSGSMDDSDDTPAAIERRAVRLAIRFRPVRSARYSGATAPCHGQHLAPKHERQAPGEALQFVHHERTRWHGSLAPLGRTGRRRLGEWCVAPRREFGPRIDPLADSSSVAPVALSAHFSRGAQDACAQSAHRPSADGALARQRDRAVCDYSWSDRHGGVPGILLERRGTQAMRRVRIGMQLLRHRFGPDLKDHRLAERFEWAQHMLQHAMLAEGPQAHVSATTRTTSA